ncbi:acyltransferase family protein [Aurantimonas sp. Leaf443]|uniref:acyltransferase family protein n=1 Tax=Aurantimonas sp. Leaf443 TaxID=1736378 RepID=UPI0006F6E3F5|nr:acyltransferase family protein [Aurantimonas sp. Leaf443]KQT86047.1 hypothetical protein ASG48_05545 [Aurantimonas sp. Leaf443]
MLQTSKAVEADRTFIRRDIEGLRAISVLAVLTFHANPDWLPGGFLGVDFFFVISGYLLTAILIRERREDRLSLAAFYERRIRRILPALFLMLAVTVPLAIALMPPVQLRLYGGALVSTVLYGSNIWLMLTTNYFSPAAEENPIVHTWSLSLEEQFYIVLPFVILLTWRLGRRWMLAALIGGALLSLAFAHSASLLAPTQSFYLLPTRAWELLLGSIIAALLDGRATTDGPSPSRRAHEAATAIGLAVILGYLFFADPEGVHPGSATLLPIAGVAALLYCGHGRTTFAGRILGLRPLVACGLISYSLYLWHQPLFAFARLSSPQVPSPFLFILLAVAAILLAMATYRFVERPFRDRRFLSQRAVFAGAALVSIAFVAIGGSLYAANGFPERLSPRQDEAMRLLQTVWRERSEAIRTGQCHFTEGTGVTLETFVKDWALRCRPKAAHGRIFVIGDSHAADTAVALRSVNPDIGQITAAGCTIRWSKMKGRCLRIFERLVARLDLRPDDTIVIAQRWTGQTRLDAFAENLDLWKKFGARVVLVSPRPEYPNFQRRILYAADQAASARVSDILQSFGDIEGEEGLSPAAREDFDAQVREAGVAILQMDDLICGLSGDGSCGPVVGETLLICDESHLTRTGAQMLGPDLWHRLQPLLPGGS